MQSLNTLQFVCGVFLMLVTIASPRKSQPHSRNDECTQIPKVVTIEQITEPVDHAEGPHWDHRSRKLYFVDIHAQKIYRLDTATEELTHVYIANGPVGVAVPVEDEPDKFAAGAGTDFVLITWDADNNSSDPIIEVLGTVDKDRNQTRFNDGKVDSHGRFWAGTIGFEDANGVTPDQASLYRLTSDRMIEKEISPVTNSNGLAWNKEDTIFYYIDSPTLRIVAYDFDADLGEISNERVAFDLPSHNISGIPDGMTIDTDGNLWIALYNGGRVINVDPVQGVLLRTIEMPADKVTSVMWGGDLFDILYVTTSRYGSTSAQIAAQPKAGSVFAVKGLGARGFAANSFSLISNND